MTDISQDRTVEVLLATYNGEKYLAALLESVMEQVDCAFSLVVSDDFSSDSTLQILSSFSKKFPGRIRLLPPAPSPLGACANFSRLLDQASADLVLFCDQDDVWLPGKLAMTIERMSALEAEHGRAHPVLVHTDLAVVDDQLCMIKTSFFRFAGIDPERNDIGALLMGNIATGCTMAVNRALYELARPIPRDAVMYDHWLAQVAAALGTIAYIDTPTVHYRQHSGNLIGAVSFLGRVSRTLLSDRTLRVLTSYSRHAAALQARYGDRLDPNRAAQVRAMAQLWTMPRHRRFFSLRRVGLSKHSLAANVALFYLVLRSSRPARSRAQR